MLVACRSVTAGHVRAANRDRDVEFGAWLLELTRLLALLVMLILIIIGAPPQPESAPALSAGDEWRDLWARVKLIWDRIVRRRR